MKLIKAYWEKQNLNKQVLEVILCQHDILNDNFFGITDTYEYVVVKLREFSHIIGKQLEEKGFCYAENMFELQGDKNCFEKILTDCGQAITYEIDNSQIDNIMEKVLFTTDRIALDPVFGTEFSKNRYKNWMKSFAQNKTGKLAVVSKEGEEIGFTFFSENTNDVDFLLTGIFEQFMGQHCGIGLIVAQAMIANRIRKTACTSVSSNNTPSLRMHIKAGYLPVSSTTVFIKHNK